MPRRGAGAGRARGGAALSWQGTPKLWAYLLLGLAGAVAAVASGRPEPLVLAAPYLAVIATGIAASGRAELRARVALRPGRIIEGEQAELVVSLAGTPNATVFVRPALPAALGSAETGRLTVTLSGDDPVERHLTLTPAHFGALAIEQIALRLVAPLHLLATDRSIEERLALRVYPRPQTLRQLVGARDTSLVPGTHVARARGTGLEFAELRPYRPGDRVRDVNWRATARRGTVWVNQRLAERSIDAVIVLDTFRAAELPRAVTAADALARAVLRHRDRVGLIGFGGVMRWIRPGMGLRQQYVLTDALLDSQVFASVVWRDLRQVPPRVLPPNALVVAVTPLIDARVQAALTDLADRGIDVAILAVEPAAEPGRRDAEARLADRLRRLLWDATIDELRARGIPVSAWRSDEALSTAVEELARWPRLPAGLR